MSFLSFPEQHTELFHAHSLTVSSVFIKAHIINNVIGSLLMGQSDLNGGVTKATKEHTHFTPSPVICPQC